MENTSVLLFWIALAAYFGSMVFYFGAAATKNNIVGKLAVMFLGTGFIAHTVSLVYRWISAGHAPYSNMYESLSFLVWWTAIIYMVVERIYKNKTIGSLVVPVMFLMMGIAWLLYSEPTPLMPALKSYWLDIHVAIVFGSYAAFSIAFGAAIVYLLKEGKTKRIANRQKAAQSGEMAGAIANGANIGGILGRFPSLDNLDLLSYRAIVFAFPLLTIGILAGAIWAEEAWGRYWGWDAKETWSLIIWLIYGAYLHARKTAGWRGKRAAWLSIIGYAAVMMTYFGVNFLLSGLHSYG